MFPLIFSAIKNAQDRAFMEQFYEQYHKLMYSQINKLTQNNDDAEEIS
jgi:DNA-directed RNA polymerase specialized sigma24 family protein